MYSKIAPSLLMILICVSIYAQEATEIYLFDLIKTDSTFIIRNPINISDNKGYDNQPSFTEDGTAILFSSLRDTQTDIARYDITENYRTWLTRTDANEYSPAFYPNKKKYFTCVRLDNDGTQQLYKYAYKSKGVEILIPNLKVGYYLWMDKNTLISFVLGDIETLQVSNFKYKIRYPIQNNIGRSLNKVPSTISSGADLMSFISKSHGTPEIYAINPTNSKAKYLTDALEGSEDLTWTIDGTILMGKNDKIFKLKPRQDKDWSPITIESNLPIKNISRLVVSPDGTKIAVVVGE
ncbi:MAG: PD40 domain-containing protein [Flavobacteriaceae bacterium]|nr:PD40 domain-containing protein [Flavobacteriaceae bacterium]